MIDIEAELAKDNPTARAVDIRVFADALRSYSEASSNIKRNGVIVSHPRTGAPIENPYLKAQKQTGDILTKMRAIKSNRVIKLIADNEITASPPQPDA